LPATGQCPVHHGERTTASCLNCGKPICWLCRQEHGYYCSEACKLEAKKKVFVPGAEQSEQIAEVEKAVSHWTRVLKLYILPAVAAVILMLAVYKLTGKAGKVVWQYRPLQDKSISHIALWDKWLFFCCEDNALYRLDTTTHAAASIYIGAAGLSQSSPIITPDGKCVVWDSADLIVVDCDKGQTIWRSSLPEFLESVPVVSEGKILYTCIDDSVEPPPTVQPAPADKGETAIPYFQRTNTEIVCLNLSNGDKLWTSKVASSFSPESIAVAGNTVFVTHCEFVGDDSQFVIEALNAATGASNWKAQLKGAGYSVQSVPAGDGLVVLTEGGLWFVVSPGVVKWQKNVPAGIWKPVVSGDRLFVLSDRFSCISLNDGATVWDAAVGDTSSEPVLYGDTVFVSGINKIAREGAEVTDVFPSLKTPGLEDITKPITSLDILKYRCVPTLFAYDARTGRAKSALAQVGGKLFLAGNRLFAIEALSAIDLMDQMLISTAKVTALDPIRVKPLWTKFCNADVRSWAADSKRFYYQAFSPKSKLIVTPVTADYRPKDHVIEAVSIGR
jgi:outer membrane protein assembly factor BamB